MGRRNAKGERDKRMDSFSKIYLSFVTCVIGSFVLHVNALLVNSSPPPLSGIQVRSSSSSASSAPSSPYPRP